MFPSYVQQILDTLEQAGYEAYAVGGCIRDGLLGREVNDYDVTTSACPEAILSVFSAWRTVPTGLEHGTVTVVTPHGSVEVTTYRIDGSYSDSRHPDAVCFTDSICADLSRRDFTVNAMACGSRGFVDPYGGREDLANRLLRAVGEPRVRFEEDALRIMRLYRFAAQLGFTMEERTRRAAEAGAGRLRMVARERICAELLKLITAPSAESVLCMMQEAGILRLILPTDALLDIAACGKVAPLPYVRLGALLRHLDEEERAGVLRSLRLSRRMTADTQAVAGALGRMPEPDVRLDVTARRLMRAHGVLAVDVADAMCALSLLPTALPDVLRAQIDMGACVALSSLAVSGEELRACGLSGRDVGACLDRLLDRVIEHPEDNTRETLLKLVKRREE